jgi:hypothetical protein
MRPLRLAATRNSYDLLKTAARLPDLRGGVRSCREGCARRAGRGAASSRSTRGVAATVVGRARARGRRPRTRPPRAKPPTARQEAEGGVALLEEIDED